MSVCPFTQPTVLLIDGHFLGWAEFVLSSGNSDVPEQDALKKGHFDVHCRPYANSE
jgi:hypothetical protein